MNENNLSLHVMDRLELKRFLVNFGLSIAFLRGEHATVFKMNFHFHLTPFFYLLFLSDHMRKVILSRSRQPEDEFS
jgi:hypothetical protein